MMKKKKKAENPVIFMYKKMWEFSEGNRARILLFSTLFAISQVLVFFEPLIVAKVLNIIQQEGITQKNITTLLLWLLSFLGIEVGFWLFHGPARVMEISNAFIAKVNYRKYLLDGTMALPASWHADHHSGDTIDKIEKASEGLRQFSSRTFEIVQFVVRFISSYIALIYFSLSSSYIVLGMIIITLFIVLQFDKKIVKRIKKLNRMYNSIAAKIFDTLSNITTVIILRIQRLVSGAIFRKMIEPYHFDRETNILVEIKWFVVSMCVVVMNALVIGVYLLQTMKTQEIILVGTISALFAYTSKIGSLFYYFAYRYGDIVRWRADVANAEELSDKFTKKEKNKQIALKKWKKLSIKNLSFKYEDEEGHALHLQDVNITINRKERIALIGQSGSGKTTFLKIIRELYDPKNVRVSIDNKLLKKGFSNISNNISLIPQDPEIFSTTIKENITVGLPANMNKIRKYTNMAKFTEVALRLPKQWESSIVEKGVNLSGGEKQRLALSRGLFASENKEIILLDEPTSSVDAKNELEIYRNIFLGFKQKTIVSSIHRLHLLPLFDTIYFFEKGKIIASGNYKELKQHCKKFQLLLQKYEKATK